MGSVCETYVQVCFFLPLLASSRQGLFLQMNNIPTLVVSSAGLSFVDILISEQDQ